MLLTVKLILKRVKDFGFSNFHVSFRGEQGAPGPQGESGAPGGIGECLSANWQ